MPTVSRGLPLLILLAACGVDETVFIPEYSDNYCAKLVECTDAAVLRFDGIETVDDCLAVIGPEIEAEVQSCDYSPKNAKRCLKAMEGMGCPGPDQAFDDVLPLDCGQVSSSCSPAAADTNESTTTPTGGSGA